MTKFYGIDKFQAGDKVQIADQAILDEFFHSWKFHHPLQPQQLQYAGRTATVAQSMMYHGGDILYELDGIPGIWHQKLLTLPKNSN